jgi:hypothetical protein
MADGTLVSLEGAKFSPRDPHDALNGLLAKFLGSHCCGTRALATVYEVARIGAEHELPFDPDIGH